VPPRFVYWTIHIDNQPTAFRAARREDLLPTLHQLQRKSTNVVMKWFARGKVWDSPEAERAAQMVARPQEKRGRDWRPGGTHKDPRDRFKKKNRPERAWSDKPDLRRDREKLGPPREARPWTQKPPGPPRSDRPWQTKPTGPRAQRKPWQGNPSGPGGPRKPFGRPAVGAHAKPWTGKPGAPPRGDRPWKSKTFGKPGGAHGKPTGPRAERKPWQGKPATDGGRKPFRQGPAPNWSRKKRDDEPPDRG
jgi:hypothetical protein